LDKKTVSLLKAYLEKSEKKLQVAQTLLKNRDYDDAVSRAYYCAFHAAQAVLLTEGLTANTHQGVVNLFGLHFVKTGKLDTKFGKFLANLKDDRENGDYEIYSAIDQETANQAVREAKQFLQAAKKFLSPYFK
jgi:hypothetical protein